MPYVIVLADDLTGAADTGVTFACTGMTAMVALDPADPPPADVLALSTESRNLGRFPAARAVRDVAVDLAGRLDARAWVYKKIDSTLRGQPAAELGALMDALGIDRALVAPAFPAQGRATRGGRQYVDGRLIEETPLGAEVATSNLVDLFAPGHTARQAPVTLLPLDAVRRGVVAAGAIIEGDGPGIVIADAETSEDLDILVGVALACGIRLLCGSAGLAGALATRIGAVSSVPAPALPLPERGGPGPVLVVVGSRHPATMRQVEFAGHRGEVVAHAGRVFLSAPGAIATIVDTVGLEIRSGRNVVLTSVNLPDAEPGSVSVAGQLAAVVAGVAAQAPFGGLVLTGGDVAAAVCRALGAGAIWLRGEVQPGIPWGRLIGGRLPGLPVVTKAGGFGREDALAAAIDYLAGQRKVAEGE